MARQDQFENGHNAWRRRRNDGGEWDGRVESWEVVAASDAFQRFAARVCELADPRPEDRLVDLGAGTGLLALALAKQVERVVAVDASPAMLRRLAERAREGGLANVETIVADLCSLPLADHSITLAVSNYAFHHLDDAGKELALSEVRRVLVPGGRLVVCDMMFSLSLRPRDRAIVTSKLRLLARQGPPGLVRIGRNALRLARGRWEHPAAPEQWRELLTTRGFVDVVVAPLEHEAGIAVASRPALPTGAAAAPPSASEAAALGRGRAA